MHRVLRLSIPLWVGGSQVYGEETRGGWMGVEEGLGVLPGGTMWEREQEMAGAQGERTFRPCGGGGGRRRRRRRRRRWVRWVLGGVYRVVGKGRAEGSRGAAEGRLASGGREGEEEKRWESGFEWGSEGRLPAAGWGEWEEPEGSERGLRHYGFRPPCVGGWVPGRAGPPVLATVGRGEHPLQRFREELYAALQGNRADALLDLLDALCGSPGARSVVELSLSPLFRREWESVPDAIDEFFQAEDPAQAVAERRQWEEQIGRLVGRYLPRPQGRKFWLVGTDSVSVSRPYARTLADRSFVYQANPVGGNAPVTIGHRYSVVALLPEPEQPGDPPWVIPLPCRRVSSDEKAVVVGAEQCVGLLGDAQQPFHGELCVQVADSEYSQAAYLGRVGGQPNGVQVVRVAGNRVFYRAVPPPPGKRPAWHPTW